MFRIAVTRILYMIIICLVVFDVAYAARFECDFIEDKPENGQPNEIYCSMSSEVFCGNGNNNTYENLENVIIDTDIGFVKWTSHYKLFELGKKVMKDHLIKEEGLSLKEADEKVIDENRAEYAFKIISHHKSKQKITFDLVSGQSYNPPKYFDEHHLIIEGNIDIYVMYVSESSGNVILFKNFDYGEKAWTRINFGRCRKINSPSKVSME